MAIEKIQQELQQALSSKEDALPRLIHKSLKRIEAWLLQEGTQQQQEQVFQQRKNQHQKRQLFFYALAKRVEALAVYSRDDMKAAWRVQRVGASPLLAQSFDKIPPYKSKHCYRLRSSQADCHWFFVYIDRHTALLIHKQAEDSERLAFFRQLLVQLESLV